MTTIFLIRHAHKSSNTYYIQKESILKKDEKRILSLKGMLEALALPNVGEFQNLDAIFSSHYSRTIMTAMPLAQKLDKNIIVDKRFGERIRYKNKMEPIPADYRIRQMYDSAYKCCGGESREEVTKRFSNGIEEILKKYSGKSVAIFSHKTAITMFLMKYCDYTITDDVSLYFNKNCIFNGNWTGEPEIFKLIFNNMSNLTLITKLELECLDDR